MPVIDVNAGAYATPGDGVAGFGGFYGGLVQYYQGGFLFLDTVDNLAGLSYNVMIHELGHALGLPHAATNSSIMTCGSGSYAEEYLHLGEQDRVDVVSKWDPYEQTGAARRIGRTTGFWTEVRVGALCQSPPWSRRRYIDGTKEIQNVVIPRALRNQYADAEPHTG